MTAQIALSICGPTASGKSSLALELASQDPSIELISADSMQVYRGMDIGTAKPNIEEQARVRHHLIDIVEPYEEFGLSDFLHAVKAKAAEITARGNKAVMVGGTALYVQAVVDDFDIPGQYPQVKANLLAQIEQVTASGMSRDEAVESLHVQLIALDPLAASKMQPNNERRVLRALEVTIGAGRCFSTFGPGVDHYAPSPIPQLAVDRPRPVLDQRIIDRYHKQLEQGFLQEVEKLAQLQPPMSKTAAQALGYKELLEVLRDGRPLEEALEIAIVRTKRFARKQQRWLRRDPRIAWVDLEEISLQQAVDKAQELIAQTA